MNKSLNFNNLFIDNVFPAPGFSMLVNDRRKILLEKSIGLANLQTLKPITPNTAFRLASLTKQFTTMAIMILKERKLLSFDDRIEKFFPDFPNYGKNISIRQLLTHTSGIPDHEKLLYKKINFGEEPNIYDALYVLNQQKKLLFKSGEKNQYSDSGFVLLALIIEIVSKKSYSDYLVENIFLPLKMKNTIVIDNASISIQDKAIGYEKIGNNWKEFDYDPLNYIVGDEGIYSTANDLINWSEAWLTDVLVSEKTLSEALSAGTLTNGSLGKYGFSWLIDTKNNSKLVYQKGTWVGFRNIIMIDLISGASIIFLSNSMMLTNERDQRVQNAKAILTYAQKKKNCIINI